jgi:hypothetical protein
LTAFPPAAKEWPAFIGWDGVCLIALCVGRRGPADIYAAMTELVQAFSATRSRRGRADSSIWSARRNDGWSDRQPSLSQRMIMKFPRHLCTFLSGPARRTDRCSTFSFSSADPSLLGDDILFNRQCLLGNATGLFARGKDLSEFCEVIFFLFHSS